MYLFDFFVFVLTLLNINSMKFNDKKKPCGGSRAKNNTTPGKDIL